MHEDNDDSPRAVKLLIVALHLPVRFVFLLSNMPVFSK